MERGMKNSGIKWIGEIPETWTLRRWRWVLNERIEKNDSLETKNVLSLGYNYGLIPAIEKEYTGGNKAREDLSDYKIVRPNDIVMNSMNIVAGSVDISKYTGCVSPVYYTFFTNDNDPRYYSYLFKTKTFQRSLLGLGNGILIKEGVNGNFSSVRMRIPVDKLKPLFLPVPSTIEEQRKIADFLDKECARLDVLIANTRNSIEEYKKLKQTFINQVVTKGIRTNREMKKSSIEWVGDIPKDWEIKRLRFVVNSFEKGNGITKEEVFPNGDTPCVRYGEIYSKYNNSFENCVSRTQKNIIPVLQYFSKGDILFAGTGELVEEIGKSIVYMGNEKCLAGGDIIIAKHSQNPLFLNYVLNSFYAQTQKSCGKTKLKVVHISANELKDIVIFLPSLEEQKEIADYLEEKCQEIDYLIEKKQKLIPELETYKKSLIYEYVTGKKEVK